MQRIQTDRGGEFFAYEVQERLRDWRIKFRPNRPRSPHLNGKVERVQRTALEEFWPTVDLEDPGLPGRLEEWRPSTTSIARTAPSAAGHRLSASRARAEIPSPETVRAAYDPAKEIIRSPNSRWRWASTNARVT